MDYDACDLYKACFVQFSEIMRQLHRHMMHCVDQLQSGAWRGRGADTFYADMHSEVLPAMERLTQALAESSRAVTAIAACFQQAEREAGMLFIGNDVNTTRLKVTSTPVPIPPTPMIRPVPTPPQEPDQMCIQVGSQPVECIRRPDMPSFMSDNRISSQEIERIAGIAGINPLVLTMVLQREWSTSSAGSWSEFLWRVEWGIRGDNVSAGIGNIKADTLIPYLKKHPERFSKWMGAITDKAGNFIKAEVIWKLFSDREFNMLAAATILADNRAKIVDGLTMWKVILTPEQIDDFTMVTYNAGIDRFMKSLQSRFDRGESPERIRKAILDTIDANRAYVIGARKGVDQEMYKR
jgi:WXG100 family type VII secretion target